MAAEAVAQGWSSLPADLVNCVADCILATNDIDYYMDLRAVCHGWRSSTTDPKTSRDERFHPTWWIVLDELSSDSDTRLFVNAATGRFLRRRLPLPRDYHSVASTTGGFLVLAEREPPHAARVLNPFTGSLIRFKAPTPSEVYMTAAVVGVSPMLVLHCTLHSYDDEVRFYLADPDSERFQVVEVSKSAAPGDAVSEFLDPAVTSALLVMRGLVVELAACPGEMLRFERSPGEQGVRLFRMDSDHSTNKGSAMERVSCAGGHALFLGASRSLSVLADSFPSVEANCVYYQKEGEDGNSHTYMYDLSYDEEERIMGGNVYIVDPASIIQLLVGYTMFTVRYEPGWDRLLAKVTRPIRPSMEEEVWEVLLYDLQFELEAEGYVIP